MTRLICIDLETTGVDIKTCEVCQVGGVEVEYGAGAWDEIESRAMLCSTVNPIPAVTTEKHGITDADVEGEPHFAAIVLAVIAWLDSADIVVTFNGASFDLPIIGRHTSLGFRPVRHVDVYRVWQYARRTDEIVLPMTSFAHMFPASIMTGSLQAAYTWTHGYTFDGAHDALVDCHATLDTLRKFLEAVDLEWCEKITASPLPGDVDWSGKLKWDGGDIVFAFGKHLGKLVSSEWNYVRWMLGADFPEDTCKILRNMRDGVMPKRDEP